MFGGRRASPGRTVSGTREAARVRVGEIGRGAATPAPTSTFAGIGWGSDIGGRTSARAERAERGGCGGRGRTCVCRRSPPTRRLADKSILQPGRARQDRRALGRSGVGCESWESLGRSAGMPHPCLSEPCSAAVAASRAAPWITGRKAVRAPECRAAQTGWTSLHTASEKGHGKTIELLLDRHADINAADKVMYGPQGAPRRRSPWEPVMSAEVLAGGGRVWGAPYRVQGKQGVCVWGKSGAAPLPRLQQVCLPGKQRASEAIRALRRHSGSDKYVCLEDGLGKLAAGRRHGPERANSAGRLRWRPQSCMVLSPHCCLARNARADRRGAWGRVGGLRDGLLGRSV